ncbi:hypothetical protein T4B_13895 [Trichinella pseudospiralis]|uniref:Uncharacterized protein n=1 Tax=Trichinella pseudospiralis TaxID=6337 RepID=A0A0V1GK46_TRIPS|nr:hypothetical protein T4B_13895 [Trichinella pseudospiralis]
MQFVAYCGLQLDIAKQEKRLNNNCLVVESMLIFR